MDARGSTAGSAHRDLLACAHLDRQDDQLRKRREFILVSRTMHERTAAVAAIQVSVYAECVALTPSQAVLRNAPLKRLSSVSENEV